MCTASLLPPAQLNNVYFSSFYFQTSWKNKFKRILMNYITLIYSNPLFLQSGFCLSMPEDYQECFAVTDTSLAVNSVSRGIPWKLCVLVLSCPLLIILPPLFCADNSTPGFTHTKHVLYYWATSPAHLFFYVNINLLLSPTCSYSPRIFQPCPLCLSANGFLFLWF